MNEDVPQNNDAEQPRVPAVVGAAIDGAFPMFPPELISEIRAKLPMSEVAMAKVELRREGSERR